MGDETFEKFTCVSNILSMYSDYKKIPEYLLKEASNKSSRILSLCELYSKDKIRTPSKYDSYIDGFVNWFKQEKVVVHSLKTKLYCKILEITGTYHMYVTLGDEKTYIVNIKTCSKKSDAWNLQLAAYQYLFDENNHGKLPKKAILHLKNDGKYKFDVYPNDEKDKDLFFSALKLHRFFKKD